MGRTTIGKTHSSQNTRRHPIFDALISHIEMESTAPGSVGCTRERRLVLLWVTLHDEAPVDGLSLELTISPRTAWIV